MNGATLFRRVGSLLVIAGLLFGACGDPTEDALAPGGNGGSATSPSDPDGVVSNTPGANDNQGRKGPQFVKPVGGMANLHAVQWQRAKVSKDGRTVTLIFYSGVEPCYVLDHVDVRYDAKTVTLTLYDGSDPNGGDVACIELAVLKATKVRLEEPLGDRKLVDGAK